MHTVIGEVLDVGVAGQEPQQLVADRFEMHLLRGEQRESPREVNPHLMSKHRQRAGAGPVLLHDAVGENTLQQVEILAHVVTPTYLSWDHHRVEQ
jgi:hypothetical protein